MANDHEPLTVIEVDHVIDQEEAQRIRDAFRTSVSDDRPVIILGPGTRAIELEPYAVAYGRAILALVIGVIALTIAIAMLVILVIRS